MTRGRVREVADAEARKWGIEVDKAFVVTTLDELLAPRQGAPRQAGPQAQGRRRPGRSARGSSGSGSRTGATASTSTRRTGDVVGLADGRGPRRAAAGADGGARGVAEGRRPPRRGPTRSSPRAPSRARRTPSSRTCGRTSCRTRTDHSFRYRVPSSFPTGDVVCYLDVHFVGDKPRGLPARRGVQGRPPLRRSTRTSARTFLRFAEIFTLLFVLLAVFLKKYHAGEVGVGTGAVLFAVAIALCVASSALIARVGGDRDEPRERPTRGTTTLAVAGFRFLFYDIPLSRPRLPRLVRRRELRARALGRAARVVRRAPQARRP